MVSGEKRNCEGGNLLDKTVAILLDIEGTTTPISFVKDVLFPYVRENLKSYVDSHWNDEEFAEDLKALKQQAKKDEEDKVENLCLIEDGEKEKETLIKNVLWQMDLDRKTTALKQLQGHIWREGYEKGKLKGIVYNDVSQMLKKWCENDKKLYIYSSGSVEAQKLLFKNSESGDLETYLNGHFDTEIGPKTEASSYVSIAKAVGLDCNQILFLTDSIKEAVAADKAGMQVNVVVREGNVPLTDDEKKAFTVVSNFNDIVFESSNKKKKLCETGQETEKVENT
ncbi:enolase-phosphatase E-1, putative [Pediculus humanus corporis]|uniref:Enolase-phosphatase E1 n=1 Tax=Pediculus humanus subsp. corporis TaxID=121224 RepID=E0VUL9_PEDHC|nr:enolase-phosphatase E-1, putative [Pediculus humanus corporis]EEB17075.1 enolase-phosphatase E-1, putative [Pediculus humanus corporis]